MGINGVVLMPTIVFRSGVRDELVPWTVFATVLTCGIVTILQSVRVRRFGAGYRLSHVSSAIFLAVCTAALVEGGLGLLATLVITSALAQAVSSARL